MSKHDEIAEALAQDILLGQYRVGERLPSERDLAARFETNRGAVREAMKKLEQLGIADIQPGGARVTPLNEASLDVIGYLLALDEVPDRRLVDQILVVINALTQTAAVSAVKRASDEELQALRAVLEPMISGELEGDAYFDAQSAMFEAIMVASGNLPVQLIARALLLQFAPRMTALKDFIEPDIETHGVLSRRIDAALAIRDLAAIQAGFTELARFHRERMQRAFDAFEAARQPVSLEATAS